MDKDLEILANLRHTNSILLGKLEAEKNRRLRAEEAVRNMRSALKRIADELFTETQMEAAAKEALGESNLWLEISFAGKRGCA